MCLGGAGRRGTKDHGGTGTTRNGTSAKSCYLPKPRHLIATRQNNIVVCVPFSDNDTPPPHSYLSNLLRLLRFPFHLAVRAHLLLLPAHHNHVSYPPPSPPESARVLVRRVHGGVGRPVDIRFSRLHKRALWAPPLGLLRRRGRRIAAAWWGCRQGSLCVCMCVVRV